MKRTYDELVTLLMKDENWEVPVEERAPMFVGMEWIILDL